MAALWSVAATAIAVLAYVAASDDDQERIAESSSQTRQLQRRLDRQVQQIEARQAAAPSAQAVKDLQVGIQDLQKLVAKRDRQGQGFDQRLSDIGARLETVEQTVEDLQQQADTPDNP